MMERLREDSQIRTVVHRRVGRPVVDEQVERQAAAGEEDQSVAGWEQGA